MDADLLWLLAAAGLLVVEVVSVTLVLGFLAVGAAAAAAVAFAGVGLSGQLAVFAVASTALLVLVRPPVKNALDRGGSTERTDPRMLGGSTAVVTVRVDEDSGQVRLSGELWRARPYAGCAPMEIGAKVSVAHVEGATLLVYSPDLT